MTTKELWLNVVKGIVFAEVVAGIIGCRNNDFPEGIAPPKPVGETFIVVGDTRSDDKICPQMISTSIARFSSAHCLVHVGDMIDDPDHSDQWKNFWNLTDPILDVMEFYAVAGNHDLDIHHPATIDLYQQVMNLPGNELWYSFEATRQPFHRAAHLGFRS